MNTGVFGVCKPLASTSASAQFGQRCSCRGLTRGREITLNHDQNSSAYPPPLLTRDFRPTASRRPQAPPPPQSSTLQCGRRNEVRALNGVGYRPRRGCRDLPPPEPAAVVHIFGMDKSHSTPSRKQPAKTRPAYSLTAEVEGLSVHVKLVLLLLESRCTSAKRRCWPSWTWLRKKSGMGRTRLSEALAELRARGLVQIVESGSRRNRSSTPLRGRVAGRRYLRLVPAVHVARPFDVRHADVKAAFDVRHADPEGARGRSERTTSGYGRASKRAPISPPYAPPADRRAGSATR